jgi:hypothetical protein
MVRGALAAAAAVLLAGAAPAQEPAGALDWFHGSWAGAGTVQGAASEATLAVAPALGGRFVELRYRFTTAGERPFVFEGRGFYRPEGAGWRGQWFDSTGATRPLAGAVDGTSLTTEWGEAATEQGRTTYRLEPAGVLQVTDEVLRSDGRWHVFASHRMTRM